MQLLLPRKPSKGCCNLKCNLGVKDNCKVKGDLKQSSSWKHHTMDWQKGKEGSIAAKQSMGFVTSKARDCGDFKHPIKGDRKKEFSVQDQQTSQHLLPIDRKVRTLPHDHCDSVKQGEVEEGGLATKNNEHNMGFVNFAIGKDISAKDCQYSINQLRTKEATKLDPQSEPDLICVAKVEEDDPVWDSEVSMKCIKTEDIESSIGESQYIERRVISGDEDQFSMFSPDSEEQNIDSSATGSWAIAPNKSFQRAHKRWIIQNEKKNHTDDSLGLAMKLVPKSPPLEQSQISCMCIECGVSFTKPSPYLHDTSCFTKGIPHKCTYCEECAIQHSQLKIRQMILKEDCTFYCIDCGKSFTKKPRTVTRKIINKDEIFNKCHECRKGSTPPLTLPTGEKLYQCTECEKSFTIRSDLCRHRRIHTREKPYQCIVCGKSFMHSSALCKHRRIHTGEKRYLCSQCDKRFTDNSTLNRHRKIHTGEKRYQCTECFKSFSQRSALLGHERIHTGEKPFQCKLCERCFTHRPDLYRHQSIHTGQKLYKCPECEKSFARSSYLSRHQMIHTGEKPYKCTDCDKCFREPSQLKVHQVYHTGEKLYHCIECDKSFFWRTQLVEHQKIHSGTKPHPCTECGKCFTRRTHLNRHQWSHAKVKPHQCTECDESFIRRSALGKHMRIHLGEKPLKCEDCDKSFTWPSRLQKHQSTHSKKKL